MQDEERRQERGTKRKKERRKRRKMEDERGRMEDERRKKERKKGRKEKEAFRKEQRDLCGRKLIFIASSVGFNVKRSRLKQVKAQVSRVFNVVKCPFLMEYLRGEQNLHSRINHSIYGPKL